MPSRPGVANPRAAISPRLRPAPMRIVTGTGWGVPPLSSIEPLNSMTAAPSETVTAAIPRLGAPRSGASASTRTPLGTVARLDASAVRCPSLTTCTSLPTNGCAFTMREARSTARTRSSRSQPGCVLSIVTSSASRVPPRSTPSHNISHTRSADVVRARDERAATRNRSRTRPPSTIAPEDGELSRMMTAAVG